MIKINNSAELLELIKEVAKNKNNWNNCELTLRLAFGVRLGDDLKCSPGDFKSNGDIDPDEMLFSQQEKNDAREKIIASKATVGSKQEMLDIDLYLSHLYNEETSPLYHGFLHEMKTSMKDSIMFLNGRFDLETFPPTEEMLKNLEAFANEDSINSFDGLVAKRGYFQPYLPNGRVPPKKNQWKRTKEGKEYYSSMSRETTARVASIPVPVFRPEQAVIAESSGRVGIVAIDTGAVVKRMKYSDQVPDDGEDNFVQTNTKLEDLIRKVRGWPKYDKDKHERYFEVKRVNGDVFTTFVRNDLPTFTIHETFPILLLQDGTHFCSFTLTKELYD